MPGCKSGGGSSPAASCASRIPLRGLQRIHLGLQLRTGVPSFDGFDNLLDLSLHPFELALGVYHPGSLLHPQAMHLTLGGPSTRVRCASPGAARTRGKRGTGQRSTRRAGSRTSSGRKWQLSFATLIDEAARFEIPDSLLEYVTRRLPREKSHQGAQRRIGLHVDLDVSSARVGKPIRRSR